MTGLLVCSWVQPAIELMRQADLKVSSDRSLMSLCPMWHSLSFIKSHFWLPRAQLSKTLLREFSPNPLPLMPAHPPPYLTQFSLYYLQMRAEQESCWVSLARIVPYLRWLCQWLSAYCSLLQISCLLLFRTEPVSLPYYKTPSGYTTCPPP